MPKPGCRPANRREIRLKTVVVKGRRNCIRVRGGMDVWYGGWHGEDNRLPHLGAEGGVGASGTDRAKERGGADPRGDRGCGCAPPDRRADAPIVRQRPGRPGQPCRRIPEGFRGAVILLDTSGLLAAIDGSERSHAPAAAALRQATVPRLLSPFVLAELDYLLATRVSGAAERA